MAFNLLLFFLFLALVRLWICGILSGLALEPIITHRLRFFCSMKTNKFMAKLEVRINSTIIQ